MAKEGSTTSGKQRSEARGRRPEKNVAWHLETSLHHFTSARFHYLLVPQRYMNSHLLLSSAGSAKAVVVSR
ncbi:MAG: hypothetical protein RQM95_00200 [Syntrophaceticus schinkii]